MNEVNYSSFVISLDLIHPSLDMQILQDYVKNNFKKDFIFINALDFVDSAGGRSSRNDTRSANKPKVDNSMQISKGIKAKIDSELAKLLDSKKRHLAQAEKQKTKDNKKSQKTITDTPPLYGGQTEVVFCIANYPYTATQLLRLKENGVNIGAMIALKSNKELDEASVDAAAHRTGDKSGRTIAKRQLIDGSDMDSSLNPSVFPPQRWSHLRKNADQATVFTSVEVGDTVEEIWQVLEKEIGRIISCCDDFQKKFEGRDFMSVPSVNVKLDTTDFKDYIKEYPDSVSSGLLHVLLHGGIKEPVEIPPPTVKEQIEDIFEQAFKEMQREVASQVKHEEKKRIERIDFDIPCIQCIYSVLYKLLKWKPRIDDSYVSRAVLDFYANQKNFHASAGHQFETMVVQVNKKYSLGLPSSFYDWQKWSYYKEYENVSDILAAALRSNNLIETQLEEAPGILWVLVMEPVSKAIGSTLKTFYMPEMIDGVDEWYKYIFEKEQPAEKKTRIKETTAEIIRNGKANTLLIPFQARLSEKEDIYRIPIRYSDVVGLTTPYLFIDGFKTDVIRNITSGVPSFNVKSVFSSTLSCESDGKTTVISSNESHMYIEADAGFTVFNENYSIFYANDRIIIKKDNEEDILITKDETIIFVDNEGIKTIVTKDASIGRFINGKWKWTSRKGKDFVKTESGFFPSNEPTRTVTDMFTKVTKYIRNDLLDLEEHEDGTVVIRFSEDFVIRITETSTNYQLPSLPNITVKKGSFSFQVADISYNIGETISAASQDFNVTVNGKNVTLVHENTTACYDPKAIQFKSSNEVLYTTPSCIERFGTIQEPDAKVNKKLEVVSSNWGNIIPMKEVQPEARIIELHKLFCPRFFAVRPDFSATEFIHESQVPSETRTLKEGSAAVLDQTINIKSFHKDEEEPIGYIKEDVPDKRERVTLLKTLQIPKKPIKPKSTKSKKNEVVVPIEDIFEESKSKREHFIELRKQFGRACESITEENQEKFYLEVHPPEIPPEIILPPRVFTPSPALLVMQAEKYAKQPTEADKVISYWDSPEGLFAKPEAPHKILPKPISPRVAMFDLETPQLTAKDKPPEEEKDAEIQKTRRVIARAILTPSSMSPPTTAQRMYRTEVMKPAVQFPDKTYRANFGNLHVGDTSIQIIKVQNTAATQLNYSFTTPSNSSITILTPPGVIASGLSISVKLRFVAKKPENVRASFFIQTNQGNIPVSCTAKVVV